MKRVDATPSHAVGVIDSELVAVRAQQGVLEARAFAVLTLDVGAVTLYLAIRERVAWDPVVTGSLGFWAFLAAVILIAGSIAFAARGTVPARADDIPVPVLLGEQDALVAARVAQLERARARVARSGRRVVIALLLAVAAIADVGLLTWWAASGW
ncbi:hypothetical protein [Pseudolysinimonas yzui]|uniref:Uncharacterized protein n=1 Tax=Pseudolysinimonas yzui TaxID=2708254 RepID=A0A8J3GNG7_9MICO|nr:hypothetical protein [Pseudolysinimonas yzui]GHF07222.1 hypothetical protein GCM10011600_04830 [Pseudolysinimonas yzui]